MPEKVNRQHPSASVFGWLRKRVKKVRNDSDVIDYLSPAGRKVRYREEILNEQRSIRQRLIGIRNVPELGEIPFRRRIQIFFTQPKIQSFLSQLTPTSRQKISGVGAPVSSDRIAAVHSVSDLIRRGYHRQELLPFLQFLIKDPNPEVVGIVIRELTELKNFKESARNPETIRKALKSKYPEVVRAALKSLKQYRYPAAVVDAIQIMKFVGDEKRSSTLVKKLGRDPIDVELALRKTEEDSCRRNAARYLESFIDSDHLAVAVRQKEIVNILFTNLRDSEPEIRRVSALVLARYPQVIPEKAQRLLIPVISGEKDESVQVAFRKLRASIKV